MKDLKNRLDTHFAACAATAGVAMLGAAENTQASIVYSGVVNISIPNSFLGVYLNIVTGVTNTSPGSTIGWDFGLYSAGANMYLGGTPALPALPNRAVGVGTVASNLAVGTLIDGASTLVSTTYPSMANFSFGQPGIFGIRFWDEAAAAARFGWVRMIRGQNPGTQGTIVDYAFENTGAGLQAGVVPAPGALALLALAGFAGRGRKRVA